MTERFHTLFEPGSDPPDLAQASDAIAAGHLKRSVRGAVVS